MIGSASQAFNVLTLDPHDPDSFPPPLLDDLTASLSDPVAARVRSFGTADGVDAQEERIKRQMRRDALTSLETLDDDDAPDAGLRMRDAVKQFPSPEAQEIQTLDGLEDTLEEAKIFLQLNVSCIYFHT